MEDIDNPKRSQIKEGLINDSYDVTCEELM